jgi:hypothetical protein
VIKFLRNTVIINENKNNRQNTNKKIEREAKNQDEAKNSLG